MESDLLQEGSHFRQWPHQSWHDLCLNGQKTTPLVLRLEPRCADSPASEGVMHFVIFGQVLVFEKSEPQHQGR